MGRANALGNAFAIYKTADGRKTGWTKEQLLPEGRSADGAALSQFTIYDIRFVDNVRVAQIFESSMYAGWFFKVVVMMIADYHDF